MAAPHEKVARILANIIFIPLLLWASVAGVVNYLKGQHLEFQNVVVISGVMDSFEAVQWRPPSLGAVVFGRRYTAWWYGVHIDESGDYIDKLRVQLQGDPSRYVVDENVFEGFDWENFRANEAWGNRVSLMVEGAELMGRAKRVRVIGLTSGLGTYLTPEVSLRVRRDTDFFLLLGGSVCGVFALFLLWSSLRPGINRHK